MSDIAEESVAPEVAVKIELEEEEESVEHENEQDATVSANFSTTDDDQMMGASSESPRITDVDSAEPVTVIFCEAGAESNVEEGRQIEAIVVPGELAETMDTTSGNGAHNCIICYKEYFPVISEENIDRNRQLIQVFCRYMQIKEPEYEENKLEGCFCEHCTDAVELLSRIDADLKTLQVQTSKIVWNCTAEILQSCIVQRGSGTGNVDSLRRQIFHRYNAKVIIRDCHQQEDDNESFVELLIPEVKLGDDVDDPVVMDLTDTEEQKLKASPRKRKRRNVTEKAMKSKKDIIQSQTPLNTDEVDNTVVVDLTDTEEQKLVASPRKRKPRNVTQKTLRSKEDIIQSETLTVLRSLRQRGSKMKTKKVPEPVGKVWTEITSSGTKINYTEIGPGQYVYMKKYGFENFRESQYKCKICLRAYPSIEEMINHIPRTHFPRTKKAAGADEVVDVFYANGFRIEKVGRRFRCPECPYQIHKKYDIKKHIMFKHYFRKNKAKEQVSVETSVYIQQVDNQPGTSNGGGTEEPTSSVAIDVNPETGEQIVDPVLPDGEENDDEEFNSADEFNSGSEEDTVEAEYIPESVRRRMKREERLAKSRLKEISPGKFVYGERFEFEQTGQESFVCHTCKRKLKTKKEMLEHVRHHYYRKDSTRKAFRIIEVEDGVFLYKDQYYFDKMGEKYSCRECGYLSKKKSGLLGHVRTKHMRPPEEKEPESCMCEECGKIFGNMRALQDHMDRMHNEGERTEVCSTCGKSFYNRKQLRLHERSHNTARPRNFVCEHCGKAFDSNQKLRSHVTIHTGEKPFECKHCHEKFKHYNVMVVHQKRCDGTPVVIPPVQDSQLPRQPELFQPHPGYGPFAGPFPPTGAFFPGF